MNNIVRKCKGKTTFYEDLIMFFKSYSCMFFRVVDIQHKDAEKRILCNASTMNGSLQVYTSYSTAHSRPFQVLKRIIKLIYHVHYRR